jgi:hypothetical protein
VKQIRKRLTYANVMSSMAVFLVIGGATAYAALGKNSVGSKQLKKNAVTTPKIMKEAVTTAKLRNKAVNSARLADSAVVNANLADRAVTNGKIADGAVTGDKIADGAVTGDKIAAGAVTTSNISGGALIPRGYAWVDATGEVNPDFTINIPDAGHPSGGEYCFTLGFQPKSAEVTLEGDEEPNDIGSVIIPATGESLFKCPSGTNLEIQVLDAPSANFNDEAFFLVVW